MAKIIAGGVFYHAAIELQYIAIACHYRQTCHPIARHAIADDLDATCIGADVAADLA